MVSSTSAAITPHALGFAQPAEWTPHAACYSAWPAHEYAWGPQLSAAQHEFVEFARAFTAAASQEPLQVLVDPAQRAEAHARLGALGPKLVLRELPYGDVWLRDIAPIFVRDGASGRVGNVTFRFNGWGEKYIYPHDAEVAGRIAAFHPEPRFRADFVFEGGAIDVDGLGTGLTTSSCLLNPNRNPGADRAAIEAKLRETLGVTTLIWLHEGLANDHTDGHIDNIARFVAPGVVACMIARDADDPNRDTLDAIAAELERASDARGQKLEVIRIPSPGRVLGAGGHVMPASHMNFYIGNARVLMPVFGTRWDEPAQRALQALFRDREVVACSARALLEGGGTLHCMTQQVPA